jgi:predicted porin
MIEIGIKKIASVALVTSCLVPSVSFAQNAVTLYGVLDEGFNYQSNSGGPSRYFLLSGGLQNSRWGLKGSEDLGGGAKAIFVLENGFDLNTGALGQGGRIFGRQAYMGLSSPQYGTIMLGRQYDSLVTSVGDFAADDQWGGFPAGHPGDVDNFNNTFRASNAVKYQSPDFYNASFSAMYALGGVAGDFTRNQVISFGANYKINQFRAGLGYLSARTPNVGFFGNSAATTPTAGSSSLSSPVTSGFASAHNYSVMAGGVAYTLGSLTVGSTYSYTQFSGLGDSSSGPNPNGYSGKAHFSDFEVNANYYLNPALLVGVAYNYAIGGSALSKSGEKPNAKYNQGTVGADYFLSKRTDIYGMFVYQVASGVDSRGVSAVAAINSLTPSSANHIAFARIGIRHKF